MAWFGLVHDSMRNISMFSRSNDPSELIRYDPSLVHTLLVNIYLKYKNSDASQRRYHELEPTKDLVADTRTCSMESNTLIGNVEKVCKGHAYRERLFWSKRKFEDFISSFVRTFFYSQSIYVLKSEFIRIHKRTYVKM